MLRSGFISSINNHKHTYMIYSGFGFVVGFFMLITAILFHEFVFDPEEQWILTWTTIFLSNAGFCWWFGRYLKQKRKIALTQPAESKKQFWAWEKPSSLFFLPVSWWTFVFCGMWIYFMINGSIPFLTGPTPAL